MARDTKRSCLSTWFPRLEKAGVPVPRTDILRCDLALEECYRTNERFQGFIFNMRRLILRRRGTPCFLRTGQGAGKHFWKRTCCLDNINELESHVLALVEWSENADSLGLPFDVFAVREMLPVEPIAILDAYGDMPLTTEVRFFIKDGGVVCMHCYWPTRAILDGFQTEPFDIGEAINRSRCHQTVGGYELMCSAKLLAQMVAGVFAGDGAWSVDLLWTRRGWYICDMADAGQSWHWPDCSHAKDFDHA